MKTIKCSYLLILRPKFLSLYSTFINKIKFYKSDCRNNPILGRDPPFFLFYLLLHLMVSTLPLHHQHKKSKGYLGLTHNSKRVLALFAFVCIFYYMFSSSAQTSSNQIDYNVNSLFWAPRISFQDTDSSAYPSSYFTSEALWKYEYKPVSAVLLRVTDDDDSIVNTVQHLLKYPFINEVYIHNFVPNRPLTVDVRSRKKRKSKAN